MKTLLCFRNHSIEDIAVDLSDHPPYHLYFDLPLRFYSLPMLGSPGVSGYNATVVALNDENGVLCGWWVGFKEYGYEELIMLLDTLCQNRKSPIPRKFF